MRPFLVSALFLLGSCRLGLDQSAVPGELRARLAIRTDTGTEPLEGAKLWLAATRLESKADAKGRAVVRRIPPGTFDVRASTPDGSKSVLIRGLSLTGKSDAASGLDLGVLVVDAAGSIGGAITIGGIAVTDAVVATEGIARQSAAVDGTYALERLPPGDYAIHVVRKSGGFFGPFTAKVEAGKRTTLALELGAPTGKPGKIKGLARQLGITDRVGLVVSIVDPDSGDEVGRAVTDADGAFESGSMPPGIYQVRVRARDGSSLLVDAVVVDGDRDFPLLILDQTAATDDDDGDTIPNAQDRVATDVTSAIASAPAGSTLTNNPFIVELRTLGGEPAADERISFEVVSGGGSVTPPFANTDAQGRARTVLTLGAASGNNVVRALAPGGDVITFSVAGVAFGGSIANLVVTAPASFAAPENTRVFDVEAVDAGGLRAGGFLGTVDVTFSPSGVDPLAITFNAEFAGRRSVPLVIRKAGTWGWVATVRGVAEIPSKVGQIVVSPGPTSTFKVSPAVGTARPAVAFDVDVTATDAFSNATPQFASKVSIYKVNTDTTETFLSTGTIGSGDGGKITFNVTLTDVGPQTLRVRDEARTFFGDAAITVSNTAIATPASVFIETTGFDTIVTTVDEVRSVRIEARDNANAVLPDGDGLKLLLSFTDPEGDPPPAVVSLPTGGAARYVFALKPRSIGTFTLAATVDGAPTITKTVTVQATAKPPVISNLVVDRLPGGTTFTGCVAVSYDLEAATRPTRAYLSSGGEPARIGTLPGLATEGAGRSRALVGATPITRSFLWDLDAAQVRNSTDELKLRVGIDGAQEDGSQIAERTDTPVFSDRRPSFRSGAVALTAAGNDLAVGDLDNDGHADVVIVGASVVSRIGDGTGSVAAEQTRALTSAGAFVALGDLNRDGKLDAVVSPASTSQLFVLLGNGNGTFAPPTTTALTTLTAPSRAALADFDLDGRLDVAVVGNGKLAVLFGNGSGGFRPTIDYLALTDSPTTIVAYAFPGTNTYPDLVIGHDAVGKITYLEGSATGPASSSPQTSLLADTGGVLGLTVAKVDPLGMHFGGATGVPYVLATHRGSRKVSIATTPTGTGTIFSGAPDAYNWRSFALADFDFDGLTDLAIAPASGTSVFTYKGDVSDAYFRSSGLILEPHTPSPDVANVAVADFNSDGRPDIAALRGNQLLLFANEVSWPCAPKLSATLAPIPIAADERFVPADTDGDGVTDLAILSLTTGRVFTARGLGDGTFAARSPVLVGGNPVSITAASSMSAGDTDNDGRDELAVGASTGTTVTILRNLPGIVSVDPVNVGVAANNVQLLDVTRDGLADVIVSGATTKQIVAKSLTGSQIDASATLTAVPAELMWSDVNGDGWRDLVWRDVNRVVVQLRLPTGALDTAERPTALPGVTGLVRGEYDTDLNTSNDVYATTATDLVQLISSLDGDLTETIRDTLPSTASGGDFIRDEYSNREVLLLAATPPVTLPNAAVPFPASSRARVRTSGRPFGADIDSDRTADVLAADPLTQRVTISRWGGAARWKPAPVDAAVATAVTRIDIESDDTQDFVFATAASTSLQICMPSLVGATASCIPNSTGPVPAVVTAMAPEAQDLDADGKPDLVVGTANTLHPWYGTIFSVTEDATNLAAGADAVALGELTGDARPDVAVVKASTLSMIPNAGTRTFGTTIQLGVGASGGWRLWVRDTDLNGAGDILALRSGATGATLNRYFVNGAVLQAGGANALPGNVVAISPPYRHGLSAAWRVIVARSTGPLETCALPPGTGCVALPTTSDPAATADPSLGDLDQDGVPELFVPSGKLLTVWRGIAGGTFTPWQTLRLDDDIRLVFPMHLSRAEDQFTPSYLPRPDLLVFTNSAAATPQGVSVVLAR